MLLRLSLAFLVVFVPSVAARAQVTEAARSAWGFDRSDLVPHPGMRFGVLANGMRYAVMRGAAPAGSLAVRLHLDAGASFEGAKEHGMMHLIEHLIFHGSANIPEGALPFMLAQRGLRRWSDFDAYTSYDETVYRLNLTKADAGARETAMLVMRDIASRLLFTRKALGGAKEKVRAEIAGRDTLADRIATAQNAFFLPGTPIARGPVAGTDAAIRRADSAGLKALYVRAYVPGRATLIVVGDADPAVVEAEIVKRFSAWAGAAAEAGPSLPVRTGGGVEARLFVDPKAATAVTIALAAPLSGADAARRRDVLYLEHMASEMLSRRLQRIAAREGAPFTGASSAIYDHFSTARLSTIEAIARGADWRGALSQTALELRRALEQGFSQAELDEQLAANQGAPGRAAEAPTSATLADAIVDAVGRELVFTAPGDGAAYAAYLTRVQLAELNTAFRSAWASPARLIFVSHGRRIAGGEQAIVAAWHAAAKVDLGPSPP